MYIPSEIIAFIGGIIATFIVALIVTKPKKDESEDSNDVREQSISDKNNGNK